MIRDLIKKITLKRVLAAVIITALAFLAEGGYTAASRRGPDYGRASLEAADFSFWEMEDRGSGAYYMLANNSYFIIENLGGVPVGAVDVYLARPAGDTSESVVRFTGVRDGIAGEFVAPLTKVSDGLYTATLDIEALDMLKIYPTELVRTTMDFEGAVLNPAAVTRGYSFARVILWGFLLGALYVLYKLIRAAVTKSAPGLSPWIAVYVFGTAGCLLAVFLASVMFTSARGLQGLLLPAGFAGFSALYVVVWLVGKKIRSLPLKAAVLVLVLGMLFCFATAPLQAPDEFTHFLRAYAIAQGDFSFDAGHEFPDDVAHLIQLFPAEFNNTVQQTGGGNALSRIAVYQSVYASPYTGEPVKTAMQSILPYLPSALGIAAARLPGANALVCMYVGRLCNIAVYALCVYFAVKWAARWRAALLVTVLLPLTLFMAASLSYDAAFLWGMALFFGVVLKNNIGGRDIAVLLAAFALMISIKPIYLPLALLAFTIPKEQLRVRVKRLPLMLLLIACGVALWLLVLQYAEWMRVGIEAQATLEGVNVRGQILYVLKNPLRYLMVILVDGYMNLFYLPGFGQFGWLDVEAPLTGLLTPVLLVLAGALGADSARRLPRRNTLLSAGVLALTYAVIVTGFYCTWSSLGSTSILGVQTRYLIPLVPCLVLLISRALSPVLRLREAQEARGQPQDTLCVYLTGGLSLIAAAEIALTYFL